MTTEPIALGIVGAAGRGGHFGAAVDAYEGATVQAVCDVDASAVADARERFGAPEAYTDYDQMLLEAAIDAVVVGTPVPMHVQHSVAALERDLHVLCEVPAAASVGECRDLVAACRRSAGTYMMAENYVYTTPVLVVTALVREGHFGDVYYAEGEYLHELKDLMEQTPWRRTWGTGRTGNTYPTHSLGPVLQWFDGDRVDRVACAGSGHHYTDPRGDEYEEEDTTVLLGKTEADRLVTLRRDLLSERPHAMTNYQLQGTRGCFEAARAPEQADRVWLRDRADAESSHEYAWTDLAALTDEFLPERWRKVGGGGHGGSDHRVLVDFLDAVRAGESAPIGVHEALDMTLPGLVSRASADADGEWRPVPDSRTW